MIIIGLQTEKEKAGSMRKSWSTHRTTSSSTKSAKYQGVEIRLNSAAAVVGWAGGVSLVATGGASAPVVAAGIGFKMLVAAGSERKHRLILRHGCLFGAIAAGVPVAGHAAGLMPDVTTHALGNVGHVGIDHGATAAHHQATGEWRTHEACIKDEVETQALLYGTGCALGLAWTDPEERAKVVFKVKEIIRFLVVCSLQQVLEKLQRLQATSAEFCRNYDLIPPRWIREIITKLTQARHSAVQHRPVGRRAIRK
ncbi:hypothetical protein V8E36_008059 [Tilletia maclaganii]